MVLREAATFSGSPSDVTNLKPAKTIKKTHTTPAKSTRKLIIFCKTIGMQSSVATPAALTHDPQSVVGMIDAA